MFKLPLNYLAKITLLSAFILLLYPVIVISEQNGSNSGSDWTMYQFSNLRNGYNYNDNISLPLSLKWQKRYQAELIPFNQSLIIGDRVIVSNRNRYLADPILSLRCLDLNTGDQYWYYEFEDIYTTDPPAYFNENIYFQINTGAGGRLFVFNLNDGSLEWYYLYPSQAYYSLGPLIHNERVIFRSGTYGGYTCLNALTGEYIWFRRFSTYELQSPAALEDTFYVWEAGTIFALTMADVELIWRNTITYHNNNTIGGCPVLDTTTNTFYLTSIQTGIFALDFITHEVIWHNDLGLLDEVKNTKDHSEALGTESYNTQGASPLVINGKVYLINGNTFYCLDKTNGELLWTYESPVLFWSPPVGANGLVFISSIDSTYAFDIYTDEKKWSYPAGGKLSIGNDHLVIAGDEGEILVFGETTTDIQDETNNILPNSVELFQNYPNPFNPTTTIEFNTPQREFVSLEVFNLLGQKIKILLQEELSAGIHKVIWDGKDDNDRVVSSGLYFYRLKLADEVFNKKMIMIK